MGGKERMMGVDSRQIAGDGRLLVSLVLAAAVGALIGYLLFQHTSAPFVRERVKHPVNADLLDYAASNRLELSVPPGSDVVNYIHTKTFTIDGDTRPVLFMHPESSATLEARLADEVRLEFAVGVDQEVWDRSPDGVEFQVEVRDGDEFTVLFARRLDPKHDPSDRRWVDASVDLSRFAFKQIDLTLRTLPGASGEFDWAGWAEPRIVLMDP